MANRTWLQDLDAAQLRTEETAAVPTARTGDSHLTSQRRTRRARNGSGWRRRDRALAGVAGYTALLPFLVFALIPVGYIIYTSFTRNDGVTAATWIGLENYRVLIHDSTWWQSVVNTFIIGGGTLVIELPLALLLAVLLNSARNWASIFRTIFFVPHVVSIAVMGVVFYFLFRPVDGVINGLGEWFGLFHNIDWLGSRSTAISSLILVSVWHGFGINTIFLLVGLQSVPRQLQESARIDGASSWQVFSRITLPLMAPVLRIVVILAITSALRLFDLVKTLTDGGPAGQTNVMFTYLFQYFFSVDRGTQYGYGSALAVVASLIITAVSVLYLLAQRGRANHDG